MNGPKKATNQKRDIPNIPTPDILTEAGRHWREGRKEQAESLCHYILGLFPGQSDALHLLGLMAYESGKLDLAILHLREACKPITANVTCLSNFAEICRQCGLLNEGEEIGRRAILSDRNSFGAWNNLGIILQELGKFEESKSCLERALQIQPKNPAVHNNIGSAYKYLGLTAQAENHWRRALTLDPNYAEPHSNLTKLFSEQAQYVLALEHGYRAIQLKPNLCEAYINISSVELAKQNYGVALSWLDRLLEFAPRHASGLAAKVLVLVELENFYEALECANRALDIAPNSAEVHNARGIALQAIGEIDSAIVCFEHAATLPGNAAKDASINLGVLFLEHGDVKKAQNNLEEALKNYPLSSIAWFHYCNNKKFFPNDNEIKTVENLIKSEYAVSQIDQMYLNFTLGKIYMDIGENKQAIDHFNIGNKIKRKTLNYSSVMESNFIESLKNLFSSDLMDRLKNQGIPSRMPIFILGMPRSGTTLIEQILSSHSDVNGAGELTYIQDILDGISDLRTITNMTSGDLQRLGEAYISKIIPISQGRQHVVDKMPGNFRYIGFIHLILPNARIIHCRRNPIDTCLSCYTKLFTKGVPFSFDQKELGQAYCDYQNIMDHWRNILPDSNFLEIDYEDVIDDFEFQTRRMLNFLDLDWDSACLDFHQTKRRVRTASVNQVRLPIYQSSKGRWHKYANELKPLLESLEPVLSGVARIDWTGSGPT
ncbi:MAG TPA: sulfotransferase [Acidiphilium sp.]|nr:sulfotransferase [Acidiphilium sp.]